MAEPEAHTEKRDRWWAIAGTSLLIMVAIRLLFRGLDAWPETVAGGAVFAVWLTWWTLRRRRTDAEAVGADTEAVPGLDRRVMREDVPEDPSERRVLARLVRRRQEKMRKNRWWAFPLLVVIFLGVSVLAFAGGDFPVGTMSAAVGVAFVGWLVWLNTRNLRKLDLMERRLAAADGPCHAREVTPSGSYGGATL